MGWALHFPTADSCEQYLVIVTALLSHICALYYSSTVASAESSVITPEKLIGHVRAECEGIVLLREWGRWPRGGADCRVLINDRNEWMWLWLAEGHGSVFYEAQIWVFLFLPAAEGPPSSPDLCQQPCRCGERSHLPLRVCDHVCVCVLWCQNRISGNRVGVSCDGSNTVCSMVYILHQCLFMFWFRLGTRSGLYTV